MKKSNFILSLIAIVLLNLFIPVKANACSTFVLKDKSGKLVFGRNFDYPIGQAYITENQRNVTKTSLVQSGQNTFEWTSKYGSVSFNQFGAEFPYGGINEAGLVIEQMWLSETKYPKADGRFALSELQWIQYQLDMSASVEDVIKTDKTIRISNQAKATLHFLVCDKKGNVATIEYLNGKMVSHKGKSLPISAITNDSYESSCLYLKDHKALMDRSQINNNNDSKNRFAIISQELQRYDSKENIIDYSFSILKKVSSNSTQWSIVYNVLEAKVYLKTKNNKNLRNFNMVFFNFNNNTNIRLNANIDANLSNPKQAFVPFSYDKNFKHLISVFSGLEWLKDVPLAGIEKMAKYPDTLIRYKK